VGTQLIEIKNSSCKKRKRMVGKIGKQVGGEKSAGLAEE